MELAYKLLMYSIKELIVAVVILFIVTAIIYVTIILR